MKMPLRSTVGILSGCVTQKCLSLVNAAVVTRVHLAEVYLSGRSKVRHPGTLSEGRPRSRTGRNRACSVESTGLETLTKLPRRHRPTQSMLGPPDRTILPLSLKQLSHAASPLEAAHRCLIADRPADAEVSCRPDRYAICSAGPAAQRIDLGNGPAQQPPANHRIFRAVSFR